MDNARFTIPKAALLGRVVDQIEEIQYRAAYRLQALSGRSV
jgi:hypothetical protein